MVPVLGGRTVFVAVQVGLRLRKEDVELRVQWHYRSRSPKKTLAGGLGCVLHRPKRGRSYYGSLESESRVSD